MKRPFCVLAIIYILIIIVLHLLGVVFLGYDKVYSNLNINSQYTGMILDVKDEKDYKDVYVIKLISDNKYINGRKFLINVKKDNEKLEYGDQINFVGEFLEPDSKRNYGGFDYSLYLKTQKIFGTFNVQNFKIISKNNGNKIQKNIMNFKQYVKEILRKYLNKDEAELGIGLVIGDRTGISKEVENDFKDSNLTHMLAVSGSHFTYIILAVGYANKMIKRNRLGKIIVIIVIILFMNLTGNTASVARSGIMAIMMVIASLFYRRADIWTSMSVAIIFQLISNPYIIFDVGLQLSYGGVIGIVLFNEKLTELFIKYFNKKETKIKQYIITAISVTLSANIIIIPIMLLNFNTLSFSFIISNLLAGPLLGVIVIFAFILLFASLLLGSLLKPLFSVLNLLISMLINIAHICANLPFSKVYMPTPNILLVIIFYVCLAVKIYGYKKEKYINVILIIIIIFNFYFPILNLKVKDLEINFIDVGQGDSTLIRVNNKSILIDGGGSAFESKSDVGEMTLLPYLLDRGLISIDYVIVSHFDADHYKGLIYVVENLKIKNIVISTLGQESNDFNEFIALVRKKNINILEVNMGDILKIGNAEIEILYPNKEQINDNVKNNNALVFKFIWNDFSILFTGDIEEVAEEKILLIYKNNLEKLQSTVLKVAHHGSKTSSTNSFLEAVNPQIALIGVGKNNKFGHPNQGVIDRLNNLNCKIYRTDEMGEISISIKNSNKISIFSMVHS